MKILAKGNSMLPNLIDGQYYDLDTSKKDPICIGDIIVFLKDDCYICHRVIDIYSAKNGICFYKTKGDNCIMADSWAVTKDDILGKIDLIKEV